VRSPRVAGIALLLVLAAACTHDIEVSGLPPDAGATAWEVGRVAVAPYRGPARGRPFHGHLLDALRSHPGVAEVTAGWRPGAEEGPPPDVALAASAKVDYRGSLWNLPITFPGFLVFTHAWHGYVYGAEAVLEIQVLDPRSGERLASEVVETRFALRHCDRDRGFWASSGWWILVVPSLVAGVVFTGFDEAAIDDFQDAIRQPYGNYLADRALTAARAAGAARTPPAPGAVLAPGRSP
jgi:hypothetical protein